MREFGELSLRMIFRITYMIINKYYPDELVNKNIQSLINIFRRIIGLLPPKKGKGKLPLFHGNGERVIPIYGAYHVIKYDMYWVNMNIFGGNTTQISPWLQQICVYKRLVQSYWIIFEIVFIWTIWSVLLSGPKQVISSLFVSTSNTAFI